MRFEKLPQRYCGDLAAQKIYAKSRHSRAVVITKKGRRCDLLHVNAIGGLIGALRIFHRKEL